MKKLLPLSVILCILFVLLIPAVGAEKTGTCGDALTWTLSDDGALTITGTGCMDDFLDGDLVCTPWEYENIKKVSVGSGVTSISMSAFSGCRDLTEVILPESVTDIGAAAFRNCLHLTAITIPSGVTVIRTSTFESCEALTDIVLPRGLMTIEYGAFNGCSALTSITLPASLTSIGYSAFYNCPQLGEIIFEGAEGAFDKIEIREDALPAAIPVRFPNSIVPKTVLVNSTPVTFTDCSPAIVDERVFLPLRAVFEALGAVVSWDDATQTVTAVRGDVTVSLTIGTNVLYRGFGAIPLAASAQLIGDRTMVPVHAVSEAFGCKVDWDDAAQTIVIKD